MFSLNKKAKERGVLASVGTTAVLFATSLGVPFERITQTTGISPAVLMDQDTHIPHKFLLKLWLMLAKAEPEKNISLELARAAPFTLLGSPWRVLKLAPDMRTMIDLFIQNHDLLSDQLKVELSDNGKEASLRLDHALDELDGGIGAEIAIGLAVRIYKEYFGEGDLVRVNFRHKARSPLSVYNIYFSVPVSFQEPSNTVVFKSETLDRPNKKSCYEMKGTLRRRMSNLRQEFGMGDFDELTEVRKAIVHQTKEGNYTVKGLAQHMEMSLRSLQRLVGTSGTSARILLTEARYNKALELLADDNMSIEQVARCLNFDSERSFRKAFKRWSQKSPSQVRRDFWG